MITMIIAQTREGWVLQALGSHSPNCSRCRQMTDGHSVDIIAKEQRLRKCIQFPQRVVVIRGEIDMFPVDSDMVAVSITARQTIWNLTAIEIIISRTVYRVVIIFVDKIPTTTFLKSLANSNHDVLCVLFRGFAISPTTHPMKVVLFTLTIKMHKHLTFVA
jgi:hypothetical protein